MTRSVSRGGATPRGGRTDARRGRGGGRGNADNSDIGNNGNNDNIGNIYGNLKIALMIARQLQDLLSTIVTQINNGTNNQGNSNGGSGEDNTNRENNEEGREHGNPRDGSNNNNKNRCSYKEFLACQPKEFDGKVDQRVKYDVGSLTRKALTWWNMDETFPHNEMQRLENEFWNHTMVGAGHTAYTDRFHKLAKLVLYLVTPKFKRIDRYIYGQVLEICRMRSSEKRKEIGETGKKEDTRSTNTRARTGKGFVATDSGKKEYKGLHPKCTKCSYHHQETTHCCTCFNCNQSGHIEKDCRTIAKWVTPVNAINSTNKPRVCYECGSSDHFCNTCPNLNKTSGQVQSNPNQAFSIGGNNFNCGNNGNQAWGRAFALGANEGQ
ncbi:reverse transcriptase domain-containing protein [Tanacetum coccineum]|uniref:Reverse transcriptase domain-containing protein n=1 Tax=Tanacetum coccineum TaxID=301880 RepID=A0ABQ5CL05_9ASTR